MGLPAIVAVTKAPNRQSFLNISIVIAVSRNEEE